MIPLRGPGSTPLGGVEVKEQKAATSQVSQTAPVHQQVPLGAVGGFAGVGAARNDPGGAKLAMQAELASLTSEVQSLKAEVGRIGQEQKTDKAEISRLAVILEGLAKAKVETRGEVKKAREHRRAGFEDAKAILDAHMGVLKDLGASDEAIATARKRLLIGLAKNSIRAGSDGKYGPADPKWLETELASLRTQLFPSETKAQKARVDRTFAAITTDVRNLEDRIAGKHKTVCRRRETVAAVDTKHKSVESKREATERRIEKRAQRLAEIEPQLTKLERRIEQLQAAITLLEAMTQIIKMENERSQKAHQKKLEELDEQQRQERLADLKKQMEKVQEAREQTKRAEAQSSQEDAAARRDHDVRVDRVRPLLSALRAEAAKTDDPAVKDALSAAERVLVDTLEESAQRRAARRPAHG